MVCWRGRCHRLPACAAGGVTVITNMGAANPIAAAAIVRGVARELGLGGLPVAAVTGDDVLDPITASDATLETHLSPVEHLIEESRARGIDVVAGFDGRV